MNQQGEKISKSLKNDGYELTVDRIMNSLKVTKAEAKEIVDKFIADNPDTPIFKHAKKTKVLAAVLLIGIFATVVVGCVKCFTSSIKETQASVSSEGFKNYAYIISNQYIKTLLKAPSSAEFPSLDGSSHTTYNGDSIFTVRSYVDAQNSFGAMLRNRYFCKLKYNGGHWANAQNWNVLQMHLVDE